MARSYQWSLEDAEDFAQFACVKMFEGRKAKLNQLFVDYSRQLGIVGRRNQKNESVSSEKPNTNRASRKRNTRNFLQVRDELGVADTRTLSRNSQGFDFAMQEPSTELISELKWILTQTEFDVLQLRVDGVSLKAIGKAFGFSESMACLHMKNIKKKYLKHQYFKDMEEGTSRNLTFNFDWVSL